MMKKWPLVFLLSLFVVMMESAGVAASNCATPMSVTVPASDLDGTYEVSWSASTTAAANYIVEESTNSTFTVAKRTVYTGTAPTMTITGAVKGKSYWYRVKAWKRGYMDSAWQNGGNGCTLPLDPPAGQPASITVPATDADGNYTVSWGVSATAGVTYVLQEATDMGFTRDLITAANGVALKKALVGRSLGMTYYYRVKAKKVGALDSAWRVGGNGCAVPLPPPIPTVTIPGTWGFDADAGQVPVSVDATGDVWWQQMTAVARQLVPTHGAAVARLGVVPFESLGLADLQGLSYSTNPISGNNDGTNQLTDGTVFAVRTNLGNYAKMQVVSYGYNLQVRWVVYNGTVTIPGTWGFDADAGQVPASPDMTGDVWWQQMTAVARQLVPTNGAAVARIGDVPFESLGLENLQGLSYSTNPITGNNDGTNQLTDGTVFAVRTNSGNYAKMQVVSYGYNLQVRWVVYSSSVTIPGTWEFDADAGKVPSSADMTGDVWWQQMTEVARQLVPTNGAAVVRLGDVPFESLGLADLQGLSYSTNPIPGNNDGTNQLTDGTVFAVRTNLGNYAKMQVVSYGYNLQVRWVVWQ